MDSNSSQYLIAEYSALREEILDLCKQIPANEKWAIVVSGVFWAWFATNQQQMNELGWLVIWIPLVLNIVLLLRAIALNSKFKIYNEYIKKVEHRFHLHRELGWENHVENVRWRLFDYYTWAIWMMLIVGNLLLAIVIVWPVT